MDNFGARYMASTMGRFLSPDFNESGSDPDPVPYADYTNPQSLNLYAYVNNNPLSMTDPDGHGCFDSDATSSTNENGDLVVNGGCNWDDFIPTITQQVSQFINQVQNTAQQAANQFSNIMNTPGGPGCMAGLAASGAGAGASAGAGATEFSFAGGPAIGGVVTGGGALVGGIGGGASGVALGMTICPGGAAFSMGGGGGSSGGVRPLQKGGNSISNATAKALNEATGKNLPAREWGRAVEELKQSEGLPPNSHGTIMSNGDYISANGVNLGNLAHYLP